MADGELRRIFRAHLKGFDLQAIESSVTGDGVPDQNYAHKSGVEGWIEMKRADHWRCEIRPSQVGWCERRLRYNPRIFCAVRRARSELWFYHGSDMRALKDKRLDEVEPLGQWTGGPARWDWAVIARLLVAAADKDPVAAPRAARR